MPSAEGDEGLMRDGGCPTRHERHVRVTNGRARKGRALYSSEEPRMNAQGRLAVGTQGARIERI